MRVIKGDQKEGRDMSGKPFLCILSFKTQGAKGEGRVMSP